MKTESPATQNPSWSPTISLVPSEIPTEITPNPNTDPTSYPTGMPSLTVSSSSLLFSTTFSTQTYRSMSNLYTQPTLSPSEPKPTVSPTSAAPTLPAPSQSPIACKFSRRCQNAIRANLTSRLACTPENACDNAEGLIGTGSCVHDFACQNKTGVCTDIYRTVLNCTQLIQIF